MSQLKNVRLQLTKLYEEFAILWIKACELENADPTSVTVELSENNPHRNRLTELNKQIHLYEHSYRYLHMKNKQRGRELTHEHGNSFRM